MEIAPDTNPTSRGAGCLLAIEASTSQPSWSYYLDGVLTAGGVLNQADQRVSRDLLPQWKASGLDLRRLDRIVVGVGPGSFSGIRAALSTALGVARAKGIPVSPLRSCDAVAVRYKNVSFLGIFSDARRGCFTFTAYKCGHRARPTSVHHLNELDDYLAKCSLAVGMDLLPGIPKLTAPSAQGLYDAWVELGPEQGLELAPVQLLPAVEVLPKNFLESQTTQSLPA